MGGEAKQEQAKSEEAQPVEQEKPAAAEEKPAAVEDQKEEAKLPSPFVVFVDLHCVGCAKKIEKSIMRIRGVEAVTIDMAQNQATIKGIVEPQAICAKIMKKTKRRAKVLSPMPAAEGEPIPEVITSQVSGLTTVELNVNMHCEACAEQLKRKIIKMRGVQTAVTELSASKVIVTGTMDANKLVEYIYRSTKKEAKIVPQPEPAPTPTPTPEPEKPEEKKEDDVKPAEEANAKPEEKKEENNADKKEEEKPPEEAKKEEGDHEEKKGEVEIINNNMNTNMNMNMNNINMEDENMKRMMYYYQPLYTIERIPPPQLFSDENPNACCIS